MPLEFSTSCLEDSIALFRHYKNLADRAIEQVGDADLAVMIDQESNSIAIIMRHIAGNLRSRWKDFLISDGEKPDRDRDSEFLAVAPTREQLVQEWEAAWKLALDTMTSLTEADLSRTIRIRGEAHSVTQAIHRQIGHAAYHSGQIVFLARHLAKSNWTSLSIPRGQSAEFNRMSAAGAAGEGQR